jgi:hypothetical protein
MLLKRYQYQLFADYFQFYLEDEMLEDTSEIFWADKQSTEIGLSVGKGRFAVGTERNFTVPVSLEIHDSVPKDDISVWDKINECSIDIPSGIIVIAGCTDYRPEAARIEVTPQCYRARIYYGGLDSVVDFDKGDDHYKVALWAAPLSELRILKRRIHQTRVSETQSHPKSARQTGGTNRHFQAIYLALVSSCSSKIHARQSPPKQTF